MDENSELIRAAHDDPALRGLAADLEFVEVTRVGSVVLRGRSTETSEQVIVKLRTTEMERRWMSGLFYLAPDLVPTVFGTGQLIALPDLGWIVMQELPPVDPGDGDDARALAHATARFQEVACQVEGPRFPPKDAAFFEGVGRRAATKGLAGADRVIDRIESDFAWVSSFAEPNLGHGDLSFKNALRRGSDAVLIDPLPSVAPWALDAAWCDICSGGPSSQGLVPLLAAARADRGLSSVSGADLDRVEIISRACASLLSWAMWPRLQDEYWLRTTSDYVAAVLDL